MKATIGIDLRGATIVAVALDDDGAVLADATAPLSVGGAVDAASAAARAAGLDLGTPVGLAAWEPNLSEVHSVTHELRRAGVGVVVTAGAGLAAAAAETSFGVARGAHYVTCLLVGKHVSAGAIVGGRPWTGSHGLAGSAAWLALNPVERQDYRNFGCLDAEVSDSGIARRLAWRVEAGDPSHVVERAGGLDRVTAIHVLDGARAGDGVAISVVRDTARYIGMAVANLIALFDPEVTVVGGLVADAADLLFEPVRQETIKHLSAALAGHLRLEVSALGERAVAIGAARLVALSAS